MIKKLRNFIVNPEGQLLVQGKKVTVNHLIPVVTRKRTKLNWKHSIDTQNTVCSHDVALDILRGPFPPEDKLGTRTYLKQCNRLFQIFNNNSEVDPLCFTEILSIMQWFNNWYDKVKENRLQ